MCCLRLTHVRHNKNFFGSGKNRKGYSHNQEIKFTPHKMGKISSAISFFDIEISKKVI